MFSCSSGTSYAKSPSVLSARDGTDPEPATGIYPTSELWAATQCGHTANHPGSFLHSYTPCPAILLAGQVSPRCAGLPRATVLPICIFCGPASDFRFQAGLSGGEQAPMCFPIWQHQHPACARWGPWVFGRYFPLHCFCQGASSTTTFAASPQRKLSPTPCHQDARWCRTANRRDFRHLLSPQVTSTAGARDGLSTGVQRDAPRPLL